MLLFLESGTAAIGHMEYAASLPEESKRDSEFAKQFNSVNSHLVQMGVILALVGNYCSSSRIRRPDDLNRRNRGHTVVRASQRVSGAPDDLWKSYFSGPIHNCRCGNEISCPLADGSGT